jgi:hypothetical protein
MQPPEKEIIGKTKKKTKNLTIVHNQRNEKFFYFRNLKKFHQTLRERDTIGAQRIQDFHRLRCSAQWFVVLTAK